MLISCALRRHIGEAAVLRLSIATMKSISVIGVSKSFAHRGPGLLREQLGAWLSAPRRKAPFYALTDVSFEIDRGESVAVVGANGSGKSTLLSLVCGLTPPDTGMVHVDGRVAALLDLGSGLHFDLTGAENLRLNASLLGLSRQGRQTACSIVAMTWLRMRSSSAEGAATLRMSSTSAGRNSERVKIPTRRSPRSTGRRLTL